MLQNSSRVRKNYITALIIGVLLLLWLGSGFIQADNNSADTDQSDKLSSPKEALTAVRVATLTAEDYPLVLSVAGRSEANRTLELRAQVTGHIVNLPIAEGQSIKHRDTICKLSADDKHERLREVTSALTLAQLEYDAALRLKNKGLQSATAIAKAELDLQTAKANVKRQQLDINHLSMKAPFDGVLEQLLVEVGDFLQPGDVCAQLLDLDPLVVSAQVSEAEISRVSIGQTVSAKLFGVPDAVVGKVSAVHYNSDPTTRTFRVEIELPNADKALRSGLSTMLSIHLTSIEAHRLPASILILDDAGGLGVRTLDSDARVKFVPVTLVGDDIDHIWVTGLPERTDIITVGQYYVSEGEQVIATVAESPAASH